MGKPRGATGNRSPAAVPYGEGGRCGAMRPATGRPLQSIWEWGMGHWGIWYEVVKIPLPQYGFSSIFL